MGSNAEYGHHKAMERIAALEAQLAACQWRKITPEDLPKKGDEIALFESGLPASALCRVVDHQARWSFREWTTKNRATHFRPINPPQQGAKCPA